MGDLTPDQREALRFALHLPRHRDGITVAPSTIRALLNTADRYDRLTSTLRSLHRHIRCDTDLCGCDADLCAACTEPWPCPTIRAIEEA